LKDFGKQDTLRRAARRDANEAQIVTALEQMGFSVERVNSPGIPDLLLSRAGQWYVAEVKTKDGRPTAAQIAMRQKAKAIVPVFRTIDDAAAWARLV
jgi:Holliday junction resolvase